MTHVDAFAEFIAHAADEPLPDAVASEAKRIVLDSVGCALAAVDTPAGRAGLTYGRILGGERNEATIIGQAAPSSVHGAAFANAELINALDFDAVAAPGHVAPYVVPVALALGESLGETGSRLLASVAVCHEICYRFAKAMDRNRDVRDGHADTPPVLGYASTVLGVTATAAVMKSFAAPVAADALGIAAATSPVNAHRSWLMHTPTSTIKNHLMPGAVTLGALTAAGMAELGHRGDHQIFDDPEFGYPRFIGTRRWEPAELTTELGHDWRFPAEAIFKPYPHCRVPHALFDAAVELVRAHGLRPEEIDAITVWGEEWGTLPTFMNRTISRPFDAQFSFVHGVAVAAHLVPPGKDWQDPAVVYSPSVMGLMVRTTWKPHPDWGAALTKDPAARPSRVEIAARGETFTADRDYPHGSPSPDPSTRMTDDELVAKFLHNAEGVLVREEAERAAAQLLALQDVHDVRPLLRVFRDAAARTGSGGS